MSLFTRSFSFLAVKPKVWVEGNHLMARTSLFLRLLSLFSYSKTVLVDRAGKVVLIFTKKLWLINRTKHIRFDRIMRIDYSFGSFTTSWSFVSGKQDQVEKFTVSLVLQGRREKVKLFSFSGEGSAATGWSGVLFGGDDIVDYAGDQEAASRRYVRLLKQFTGKTMT